MKKLTQTQVVIEAMKNNGGTATLKELYSLVLSNGVEWNTKTPEATIRRIVQNEKYFTKINRGLWTLKDSDV